MVNGSALKIVAGICATTTIALSSFIFGEIQGQDSVEALEAKVEVQAALDETRFDVIEKQNVITDERYSEILRRLTSIEDRLPR